MEARCPRCGLLLEERTLELLALTYARHVGAHPLRCQWCGGDIVRHYDEFKCLQCSRPVEPDPVTGQIEYRPYVKGPEQWPPLKNPLGEQHSNSDHEEEL